VRISHDDSAEPASGFSRLVLVRHGETVGNSSIRYYGRSNIVLSDQGRRQMVATRDALAQRFGLTRDAARFDPIFASPLSRAREGATIITGASPILIDEFVETDFGAFEGLTADEIRDRYPEDFVHWTRHRLDPDYAYPEGESRAAFLERVHRGVTRMLNLVDEAHGDRGGNAIVVAHRGVIRAITQRLVNVSPVIELGSIHCLIRDSVRTDWRDEFLDYTQHVSDINRSAF
jgi:broad specificity phosphatase PhoE